MSVKRVRFELCLVVICLTIIACTINKPVTVKPSPPVTITQPEARAAIKASPTWPDGSPMLICAVKPGTTALIPSCGPDPNNPVSLPCANIDGSFKMKPGSQLQFGMLNPSGLSCDLPTPSPSARNEMMIGLY